MKLVLNFLFFWSFEIVSNFVLRASNFFFLAPLRLCERHGFSDLVLVSEFQILLASFCWVGEKIPTREENRDALPAL